MTGNDPNLDLVVRGVAAICDVLTAQDAETLAAAGARWDVFEDELRRRVSEDLPLAQLSERFRLDSFELRCLMLALAPHIEPGLTKRLMDAGQETFGRAISVRVAMDRFCDGPEARVKARRKLLPDAPLVRFGLLEVGRSELGSSGGLLGRRLELSAPTLRFILREHDLSDSVGRIAQLEYPSVSLLNVILEPGHRDQVRELVEQHARYREIIGEWGFDQVLPYGRGLTLMFSGPPGTGKTLLAQALAAHLGRPLLSLSASDLPEREGIDNALTDLFNEATLRDAVVLVDECDALLRKGDNRKAAAFKALERHDGILILTTNHPDALDEGLDRRIIFDLRFEMPTPLLRQQIWEVHLPPGVPLADDIDLVSLANLYDFPGGAIKNAILVAVNRALARNPRAPLVTMALLEEGCRSQLRYALEELTVRTTTHLRLSDIVLRDETRENVVEIIRAMRNQAKLLNHWGFGRKLVTGKGITVLFDGPPGTGKTLCAEIIAGELDRPLYRVNLPEVVSKWMGETEKNIKAIFQQARISHAMLLFDEADSLFGARTQETRSSNDRAANMEVNLLLQEIERFPGVAILTTNFFGNLDRALIRRLQFRVTFEDPKEDERRRIWETLCPQETPLASDVEWGELARRFELTGGMIKNALVRAAYRACELDVPLSHGVLMQSCRDELKAAGKLTRDPDWKPLPPRARETVLAERAIAAAGDGA
ncbi:MAG: ATP-binding protein [Myxococcota bacterium]